MSADSGGSVYPAYNHMAVEEEKVVRLTILRPVLDSGLSLRDYFAGQALTTFMRSSGNVVTIAEKCYRLADEMLKERAK